MGNRTGLHPISLAALLIFTGAMVAGTPRNAFPQAAGKASGEEVAEARSIEVKLYDLELLDQDGRKVRFASDVVGDRIVVIDTFFTTCGLICPILSAIFADLQEKLVNRLGEEVALLSISLYPPPHI